MMMSCYVACRHILYSVLLVSFVYHNTWWVLDETYHVHDNYHVHDRQKAGTFRNAPAQFVDI